jgi:hypothetical protein
MFNFKYTISKNPEGRPTIEPIDGTEKELKFIEHKFMAFEITRTIMNQILNSSGDLTKFNIPKEDIEKFEITLQTLYDVSNHYAKAINDQINLVKLAETEKII